MKKLSNSWFYRSRHQARTALGVAGFTVALLVSSAAQSPADAIRKAAKEGIETADTETAFKKQELAKKYAAALESLEKKLTTAGDLDGVLHVREERTEVQKSGKTTAHQDKSLVELRGRRSCFRGRSPL